MAHSELNPASPEVRPAREGDTASANGCMVRVAWLASNVAVVIIAGLILREKPGPVSVLSAVFWANVLFAIALHYWEVKAFNANTLDGKPATLSSWRRYSLRLVAVAAAIWLAALYVG